MQVALLQVASPDSESPESRRVRLEKAVRRERHLRGADLLVLPELWTVGYFAFDKYAAFAEHRQGPTIVMAQQLAADLRLTLHLGSVVEVDSAGRLHNTSIVIDPNGAVILRYRKVHLFGYGSLESEILTAGTTVGVCTIAGIPTGATTCYDLRFPELFRSLVDAGAEQVAVCAAWPSARLDAWRLFTQVRAAEQQMYVVAANAVGEQAGVRLAGHSRVIDPYGDVVVEAAEDEGFTFAELDPRLPRKARAEFPALADRRWPTPTPHTPKELP